MSIRTSIFPLAVLFFLLTARGYASGSITCSGPNLNISWGVSHMSGAPMYGNPLKISLKDVEAVIPQSQVVGYYAHDGVILLLALDEHMDAVAVDLRYGQKKGSPSTLLYRQTAYAIHDCHHE